MRMIFELDDNKLVLQGEGKRMNVFGGGTTAPEGFVQLLPPDGNLWSDPNDPRDVHWVAASLNGEPVAIARALELAAEWRAEHERREAA